MRRFDFGVLAYGQPEKLDQCLSAIRKYSQTDFRCRVVVNPYPDKSREDAVTDVALKHDRETRGQINLYPLPENVGYAGGVNVILQKSQTEYIGYLDHDAYVQTPGWDEAFCSALDRFHEIGMIFPAGGAYPVPCGEYNEILWGVGCCWALNRLAYADTGLFDTEIGHHEEVDYQTRVRLQGYKIASLPTVSVAHDGTASSDPASIERINKGVRAWVDKWCRIFGGKGLNYHSTNVLRVTDWPPNALHMERFFKLHLGENFNSHPNEITINGEAFDLIRVPRPKGHYRTRII